MTSVLPCLGEWSSNLCSFDLHQDAFFQIIGIAAPNGGIFSQVSGVWKVGDITQSRSFISGLCYILMCIPCCLWCVNCSP